MCNNIENNKCKIKPQFDINLYEKQTKVIMTSGIY